MNSEGINTDGVSGEWAIDLNWYNENGCSFLALTQDYLCAKCRKRLKKEAKPEDIIKTISTCCSKKDNFFRADMPVMASVFRYLLASGNAPLELDTLSRGLSERRGTLAGVSPGVLYRLLINDKYYGIRNFSEERKI